MRNSEEERNAYAFANCSPSLRVDSMILKLETSGVHWYTWKEQLDKRDREPTVREEVSYRSIWGLLHVRNARRLDGDEIIPVCTARSVGAILLAVRCTITRGAHVGSLYGMMVLVKRDI